jgi:hypothetical protein
LFDQPLGPFHGCLGFRRGIAFDMHHRRYERHLMLDLFATQRRRGGRGRDQGERAVELCHGFNQSRALQRPPSGFAPQARGFLDQPSLGE